ncbi:MAG: hypothetical protein NC417_12595 [Candidatus Gastranaerophilales bacterium]|nr:hypothetical protein [Candidatus Gastranaerophilales bacterium]
MRKRVATWSLALLFLFGMFAGKLSVSAEAPVNEAGGPFSGDVVVIGQDNGNYLMQVTVENQGEDFSGTVQLIIKNTGPDNCAYNTELSLASQGKKQFLVTMTDGSADTIQGSCSLNFLDGNGKVLQSIALSNIFGNITTGLPVGVLSDDYSSLTYLDAGGNVVHLRNQSGPLSLVELDRDNLMTYLNSLMFLVIDHYNVSTLEQEQIQAIQDWVQDGGMLIIGTGAYAMQTLSGFDEDFLNIDINLVDVSEPGEANPVYMNVAARGYYYYYESSGIDFFQMPIADLVYSYANAGAVPNTNWYDSSENPALISAVGQGAVAVYYCSLGESSLQWLEYYMIQYIYEELTAYASTQGNYHSYSDMNSIGQRALSFIDHQNTTLNFGLLEILIAFYVVLVGPLLYLILRKWKKREWYWVCAPAVGLFFIFAVFILGQSARVNDTRVYSITMQQADSDRMEAQVMAYHSGVKPWSIRLNDRFEAVGPGWNWYSYYYTSGNGTAPTDYYYLIQNDGQGLSVGIRPNSNFENGWFYANGRSENKGSLTAEGIVDFGSNGQINGCVTNDTVCDMAYMAVWFNDFVAVFSDVKAGETIDLAQAEQDGRCVYQNTHPYYDDFLYGAVNIYGGYNYYNYEQDDIAALAIGLGMAMNSRPSDQNCAVIAGIVRDYDKVVTEKSNEIAYGCIFSYAETEVTDHYAVY